MKRLLITCAVNLAFAMGAWAQGWITFNTAFLKYGLAVDAIGHYYAGTYGVEIWELNQATVPPGVNLPMTNSYGVAAYQALVAAGFHREETYVGQTTLPNDVMRIGTVNMPDVTPAGATVAIAIAVWNNSAASWDAMLGSADAATRAGVIAFTNVTGDPTTVPPEVPPELYGWNTLGTDLVMMPVLPVAAGAGGVVTNCTESALRAAMAGGGVVTFACDGTILLANTITNDNGTTLDASGRQVTISGNNSVRVFYVNTKVSFTVVNLTIADGASVGGSAILNLGGTVSLTGVTFRSNNAAVSVNDYSLSPKGSGGAIFNRGGAVNASNCSFAGNTAHTPVPGSGFYDALAYGGAIRNEAGQVDLRSCAFVGNQAFGGTAYYPLPGDRGLGGAIHNSGTVRLDLCTLAGNSAAGGGGGGNVSGQAGASGSEGSGGAIFNQGTLMVDRTTLCGNTATAGSGGSAGDPSANNFYHGSPGGTGGGAYGAGICNLGSLWVTRSTFATNVVAGGAGGAGGGSYEVVASGGDGGAGGDGGSGLGGALFNSGAASLVNCTIAFNTGNGGAGGGGGAGAGYRVGGPGGGGGNGGSGFGGVDGTCNLTNSTVACNLGHGGSGGVGGAGSIGNPTPGVPGTNGAAWGGTVCSTLVNTLIASNTPAGNDTFTDPKLGPLANNGGPTLTMALLPGSPAIDAGNTSLAPATDQRGFPRPAGLAADIGAFEYGLVMPTLAVSRSGATGLRIVASGNAGQSCRLLSSPDLSSWVPLATNQIGGDGTVLFYDTYAPGGACRFYRLVMP